MSVFRWSRRQTEHFGEVWVPLAQIELKRADGGFQAFAVQIDSGAVVSLLRRSVADLLGLRLEGGRRVELGSVGGATTVAYVHELTTRFGGDLILPVRYAIAESESVPNLLGRLGVFDRLQVDFDASVRQTKISAPWLNEEDRRNWEFMLETCKHIEQRWDQLDLNPPAAQAVKYLYDKASRLVVAVAGLLKLHREHEAPILIRTLFEVAVQFEYLMQAPDERGRNFIDFAFVTRYRQSQAFLKEPRSPLAKMVADSPLREQGERDLEREFERVKGRFMSRKKNCWKNWHGKSVAELARLVGWEDEYRLWYAAFSNWVHADPIQAGGLISYDGRSILTFSYHYFARMLLRIADHGEMILTADQHGTLKAYATAFT